MKRGQAILAQAVLLAPVLASIFNLWAAGNPMTPEERTQIVQVLKHSFDSSAVPVNGVSVVGAIVCLPITTIPAITFGTE